MQGLAHYTYIYDSSMKKKAQGTKRSNKAKDLLYTSGKREGVTKPKAEGWWDYGRLNY